MRLTVVAVALTPKELLPWFEPKVPTSKRIKHGSLDAYVKLVDAVTGAGAAQDRELLRRRIVRTLICGMPVTSAPQVARLLVSEELKSACSGTGPGG